MRLIQARNYTAVPRETPRPRDLIVLHSTENSETPGKAYDVACWFAATNAPEASAHFVIDSAEMFQCVDVDDIAWAAPGANRNGLHIELVGYARQAHEDWADTYSQRELDIAAHLVADLCFLNKIPARFVDAAGLLAGARGITRHMDVSAAFGKSTHADPGEGFPIHQFVQRVSSLLGERTDG